ncbi:uncharacterized protein SCHCODRAFT_02586003, partial [Schizophyllum commune H4-8]|uniref:uncharacterized protein n=1 Tax=Schizophyllum commune (strain H4-8 / FGSC 9210) TaxID=578458 RepID=UPI00215EF9CF
SPPAFNPFTLGVAEAASALITPIGFRQASVLPSRHAVLEPESRCEGPSPLAITVNPRPSNNEPQSTPFFSIPARPFPACRIAQLTQSSLQGLFHLLLRTLAFLTPLHTRFARILGVGGGCVGGLRFCVDRPLLPLRHAAGGCDKQGCFAGCLSTTSFQRHVRGEQA